MTTVDWIAVGVIAIAALAGLRRGLIGGALATGRDRRRRVHRRQARAGVPRPAASPRTRRSSRSAARRCCAILLQSVASMAGSAIRGSLFAVPPLRLARLARRPRARRSRRRRDRLGPRRGRAAPARTDGAARGGAALSHPRRDQRARPALAPARRDRARRPVPRDPRAGGERRAARSGAAREPGRPQRPRQRLPGRPAAPAGSASPAPAGRRRRTSSSRTPTSSPG